MASALVGSGDCPLLRNRYVAPSLSSSAPARAPRAQGQSRGRCRDRVRPLRDGGGCAPVADRARSASCLISRLTVLRTDRFGRPTMLAALLAGDLPTLSSALHDLGGETACTRFPPPRVGPDRQEDEDDERRPEERHRQPHPGRVMTSGTSKASSMNGIRTIRRLWQGLPALASVRSTVPAAGSYGLSDSRELTWSGQVPSPGRSLAGRHRPRGSTLLGVLTAIALVIFTAVVIWLSQRPTRVQPRSCCQSGPWPPLDLIDSPADGDPTAEPDLARAQAGGEPRSARAH